MSYLVANIEDKRSCDMAQFLLPFETEQNTKQSLYGGKITRCAHQTKPLEPQLVEQKAKLYLHDRPNVSHKIGRAYHKCHMP